MDEELTQNLWERFGFRDNPFDTRALSLTTESRLSVAKAFVGRDKGSSESSLMTNFLKNPTGGSIVVEGDVGVGKTTFVNYHRYVWEKKAKTKLLTPASEISVQGGWGAHEFLISILGSLAGRLALEMERRDIERDQLFNEVYALTKVLIKEWKNYGGGVSIFGTGANYSSSQSLILKVGEVTVETLKEYLRKLLKRVLDKGYAGIIFHIDNLELVRRRDPSHLSNFFDEVRDILQEPNIHFVFVGYTGMFQEVIAPVERVESIFVQPIHLPALDLTVVHSAIKRRYELLSINENRWIPPVEDSLIDYLWELFSGKIRSIMNAITTLFMSISESITNTLPTEDAKKILKELTLQSLKNRKKITDTELAVLECAAKQRRFTNSSLAEATEKSKQNVTKYINRFVELSLINQAGKQGRNVFYEIAPNLSILCYEPGS